MRRTLHHEGPRSSTKPCGSIFNRNACGAAGSTIPYNIFREGPRRTAKPCGKHTSPQGFVFLRVPSWSNLRRMASCPFVPLRGKNHRRKASRSLVAQRALRATKNHSAWSSRPLAALRGQILRRKASCSFVSLRGQHSAARLRASSCLFVVKPPPQGFAFLSGPSRTKSHPPQGFVSLRASSW